PRGATAVLVAVEPDLLVRVRPAARRDDRVFPAHAVGVMTGLAYLDWAVLIGTIAMIVIYGAWRSRNIRDATSFVRGDGTLRWPTIGLSIMATQASAITFISTPGQVFDDGMRFVQFYLGLPFAMIVISAVFVPVF